MYGPIFLLYMFFFYFGVLNVVVGAFVSTTSEVAAKDKENMVKGQMARMQHYRQKVELFFREADIDKNGALNWEEFQRHLQNEHVKAYFEALELDAQQARSIDVNMLILYSKFMRPDPGLDAQQ